MSLVKITMTLQKSADPADTTEMELFIPEAEMMARFNLATGKQATIDLYQRYFSPGISSLLRTAYPAEEQALYDEFQAQMAVIEKVNVQ